MTNWLFIEPYVHISRKKNEVLLYNTLNGKSLIYKNNASVSKLVSELQQNKNLYVIEIKAKVVKDKEVKCFISELKQYHMGDIIKSDNNNLKPFQIKPIVNVQKDFNLLSHSKDVTFGTRVMLNMRELTISINSHCELSCKQCNFKSKQFLWCTKNGDKKLELEINEVSQIFEDLISSNIEKVYISGGNILLYNNINTLIRLSENMPFNIVFCLHYNNIKHHPTNLDNILSIKNIRLSILVDNLTKVNDFSFLTELINYYSHKLDFQFSIESIEELNIVESIISTFSIKNFKLHPYFNNSNFDFFKANVFNNKQDILERKPSILDIETSRIINTYFFGKLSIMSNGDVYAGMNGIKRGNIKKNNLHKSAYLEMKGNGLWKKTRCNVSPCKKCVFNSICPPISNYELVLKKYDLCNIRKFS